MEEEEEGGGEREEKERNVRNEMLLDADKDRKERKIYLEHRNRAEI